MDDAQRSTGERVGRAIVAGAIGGLVGGGVKMLCEMLVPPRPPDRTPPPAILIGRMYERQTGRPFPPSAQAPATLVIHYLFSALSSAGYAVIAEFVPAARVGRGTAYGVATWAGAHEYALPKLELTPPRDEMPLSERANELVTHGLWGLTVEAVRRRLAA